jgi:hypothetical protein
MKFPVIQVQTNSLFASVDFDGTFVTGGLVQTRHDMTDSRLCYVIDSVGDLWSFTFVRTDYIGVRKIVSRLFWNISTDHYTFATATDISVKRFREIVEPHQIDPDPFHREIALHFLESVASCDPSDRLRDHIHLLNL